MEIGSEFNLNLNNLNYTKNNIFNYLKEYNTCYFDTGRSAIKSINLPKGKILLPIYICDSIIDCFDKKDVIFYKINGDFSINKEDILNKLEKVRVLFVMHYYGCVQNTKLLSEIKSVCKKKSILIIEDTTHSLLSKKSTIGDYMICSLRKWFPITRGGVVYSKNKLDLGNGYKKDIDNSKVYAMIIKDLYLNNKFNDKDLYLNIFNKCEKQIENKKEVLYMSDLSMFILSCCDVKEIKEKRISNYKYLKNHLKVNPVNVLKNNECPFVYLIRSKNRDALRKHLINNNIYCAVHWPNCSNDELSLTIDNRYSNEDMKYIIKCINRFNK